MNKLWDDLKDNMKEWGASAVEKAEEISRVAVAKGEEFTKISKIKIDIMQLEKEITKRNIKPTKLLPLWDLLGLGLGFGSTILGKKAAMLCTASVEEVIDDHYKSQIELLESDEKNLKKKIIKFREDELHHKDIAYEKGATKKGIYSLMDKIVKTGSKVAITVSKKI